MESDSFPTANPSSKLGYACSAEDLKARGEELRAKLVKFRSVLGLNSSGDESHKSVDLVSASTKPEAESHQSSIAFAEGGGGGSGLLSGSPGSSD
jgi:hypothetical protein